MVSDCLPEILTLGWDVAPEILGSGRYRSGSGTGGWLVLIGPIQLPLPLIPGEPLKSISWFEEMVTVAFPVATPPLEAFESTISGAPTTDTEALPFTVSAPGDVGSRIRMPSL